MASSLSHYTLVAGNFSSARPDISHRRVCGRRRHSFLGGHSEAKVMSKTLRSRKLTCPRAINQAGAAPTLSERSAPRLELPTQTDMNELSPADSENRTEESEDRFTWSSNWFAVQVVEFMDASRPHAVTVLGRPYVLWRDAKGEWRCFVDECPHRLVPLSEGRIDSEGRLQCSYHGWSFGSGGACESIPQAAKQGPGASAPQSPRACAIAVPSLVAQGILFIWPDERGWEKALATPPPLPPNTDGPEWKQRWSMRDLPYGYELLAENVVDVSHLPFAHHGVGSLKREGGKPLPLQLTSMVTTPPLPPPLADTQLALTFRGVLQGVGGFTGYSGEDVMAVKELFTTFQAPSRYTYDRVIEKGAMQGRFLISLYLTPTTPGHSRIVLYTVNNFPLPKWMPPRPHVLGHLLEQDVLDGDAFFLHAQERALQRRQADPHRFAEDYFMPTSADRFVVAYRQWLAKYAGGAVQWPEGTDTRLEATCSPREEVMDRFKGHTRHCTACSGALSKLEAGERVLVLFAVVLLAVAAVLRSNSVLRLILAGAAVGSYLLAEGVKRYKQVFVYTGYDHAAKE